MLILLESTLAARQIVLVGLTTASEDSRDRGQQEAPHEARVAASERADNAHPKETDRGRGRGQRAQYVLHGMDSCPFRSLTEPPRETTVH